MVIRKRSPLGAYFFFTAFFLAAGFAFALSAGFAFEATFFTFSPQQQQHPSFIFSTPVQVGKSNDCRFSATCSHSEILLLAPKTRKADQQPIKPLRGLIVFLILRLRAAVAQFGRAFG